MHKLVSANFTRLWKDKMFWIIMLIVFLFALVTIRNGARVASVIVENGFLSVLDEYYFTPAPYMGIAYAAFISLFVGTEYSDGTMRNKIVVGHTRTDVYFANFLVCFVACLLLMVAWLVGGAPGLILFGPFQMGVGGFWVYFLVAMGFTASFTALFTWISMVSDNKARTILLTLAIWMALVLVASDIENRLDTGTIHSIFECLYEFIPAGQTMLMHDVAIEHPARLLVFSAVFTVCTVLSGIVSFRRKDLK